MQNCYAGVLGSGGFREMEAEVSLSELFGEEPGSHLVGEERRFPQLVLRSTPGWKCKPYSLLNQLKNLYHEELRQNPDYLLETRKTSYLLGKLVQRERYNLVVITLNPVGEGFSVCFQLESGKTLEEEAKYPYTQDALLDYIDKGQLPTPFLDYWEHSVPQLFYDGCVVCQVRDQRHGLPASISHVLLQPHTQSLVGDINKLLMDSNELWTPEEQFNIESDIINNANRPLCLDPDPNVGRRLFKLHQDQHAFDNISIRKLVHSNSPLLQHRKRKYEHLLPRSNRFLSDFINAKRIRTEAERAAVSPPTKQRVVAESQSKTPRFVSPRDACRCAKCRGCITARGGVQSCGVCRPGEPCRCEPQQDTDDFSPRVITEWILENKVEGTTRHVRLTILQRPVNFEYLAQIYMDNKYVEGKSNGSTCRFTLGSRDNAHSFVKQYIELYTAEGRQKVNITQLGPGHIVK